MRKLDSGLAILLLAAALTAAAPQAFPQPPQTREAALGALAGQDAAARAEAIVWLANRGTMADARLLQERLRDESALVRSYAEQGLWLLWLRSGDSEIDSLMARGIEEMQTGQHASAIGIFTRIIEKKPDFAEGWNKRATALFLAGEYRKSLADCNQVLKRNPGHFGALSGAGLVHMKLQEYEQALAWFRRALEVNPNMIGVEVNIKEAERLLKERRGRAI
jgi:tetratricopeptide (TPR) repeat protein